jgi:uncharacterized protein YndB with AHSA1/START domain
MTSVADIPAVRKTITIDASVEHAFRVFTEGHDSWWPRTHHIGKVPMQKGIIETREGGRCYSIQTDGSECDWGRVLVWEPPRRFVMAWQITGAHWQYEPDITKSSEVEVRFTPVEDGSTRVDLEHRHFNRYGPDADAMRQAVSAPNGWSGLLQLFATRAEAAH